MGHAGYLKEEYRDIVGRLNSDVVGLPEPENDEAREGWRQILELMYTPEEAEVCSKIPVHPTSLEKLSQLLELDRETLRKKLGFMADKGIVMDMLDPETGNYFYSLSPPVYGFFELTMMKVGKQYVSKEAFAKAVGIYGGKSPVFSKEVHGSGDTALGRTLIYESVLKEELIPQVYEWEKVVGIIKESQFLAVSNCYCRHKAEHSNSHCDAPMEACFSLNEFGEYVIRRNFGRKVEIPEALAILETCKEHGLVHLVDNVRQKPAWLCNCCSCCCGVIKSINTFDFPAVNPSNYVPEMLSRSCTGCRSCIKACPIGAIDLKAQPIQGSKKKKYSLKINEERCIGCGVCIGACKKQVILLGKRKKRSVVPDSALELRVLRAFERGRLAELVFDKGTSWGSKFMNLVLKVVTSLPLSKRLDAAGQLKSKFIYSHIKNNS